MKYKVFHFFIRAFFSLPMWVLYRFSDIAYVVFFYILNYRKKVVIQNLINSFPDKSENELYRIMKKFYKNLADQFVESLAIISFTKKDIQRRCKIRNPEILNRLYDNGKSVIGVMGHQGNWEWLYGLPYYTGHKVIAIYKPMSNKYFNRLMVSIREKHGIKAVAMNSVLREILASEKRNEKVFTLSIADQTPLRSEIQYWTVFLNQETPVYLGSEKIARKFNHAVVFLKMYKIKRGYYEVEIVPIIEDAKSTSEFEITEKHTKILEQTILEQPASWLWSHRRWKHKS